MKYLDHRGRIGTLLYDQGLARFHTKKQAEQFAKEHGWRLQDVTKAANRFWEYWVVGQCVSSDTFRYLTANGTWVDDDFPGYWST